MTSEREQEIRAHCVKGRCPLGHCPDLAGLLAEIDRLRAENERQAAALRMATTIGGEWHDKLSKAIAALEKIANPPPHASPDWAVMQARRALKELKG